MARDSDGKAEPQVADLLHQRISLMLIADLGASRNGPALKRALMYSNLVDAAIDQYGFGPSLFRTSPEILIGTKATIRMIMEPTAKKAVGGLHTDYSEQDDATWIGGVVKVPGEPPEVMLQLLARTLVHVIRSKGLSHRCLAAIRQFAPGYVDPKGRPQLENQASLRLFKKFGFETLRIETVEIAGNFQDRHLFGSADPDGKTFRTRILTSTPDTVEYAAAIASVFSMSSGRA